MQTTANDYKLSAADLTAIRGWMKFLETFGSGMPPAENAIRKFFAALPQISDNYDQMTNSSYRWMVETLFFYLNEVPNNREVSLTAQYGDYCEKNVTINPPGDPKDYVTTAIDLPFEFRSFWATFLFGYGYKWYQKNESDPLIRIVRYDKGLNIPGVNRDRHNAIIALTYNWDPIPSKDFIVDQTHLYGSAILAIESAKKVVTDWASAYNMPQSVIIRFEAQQRLKMKDMIGADRVLNADEYLFIFHLMISLCTATNADRTTVLTIVKEQANSIEYPNETFINQLVYLALLHTGNPKGDIRYSNLMMQDMLKDMLAFIKTTDEASNAIKASIEMNIHMLHANAAYPMHDMYNPDKSFNTRFTDTLAALEDGRKIIKTKLIKL